MNGNRFNHSDETGGEPAANPTIARMHPSLELLYRLRDGQRVWNALQELRPEFMPEVAMGLFGGHCAYGDLQNVRMLSLDTAIEVVKVMYPGLYEVGLPIAASIRCDHVVYADVSTAEVYFVDDGGECRRAAPPGVDVVGWALDDTSHKKRKTPPTHPKPQHRASPPPPPCCRTVYM